MKHLREKKSGRGSPVALHGVAALALIMAAASSGCGRNEKTEERAIRTESKVLDMRVSEAEPDTALTAETDAEVGFDARGQESRMLIHFPGLLRLWDEKVIVSSIAVVELIVNCVDVPVNPENIQLRAVARPWTPFATWNSPLSIVPGHAWARPGGDVDDALPPVTPTLRAAPKSPAAKELAFDITALVKRMILDGRSNHGFLVSVRKSALNASQALSFKTVNAGDEALRPTSILTFNTKDGIQP